MTYDEFLRRLRETPRTWYLKSYSSLMGVLATDLRVDRQLIRCSDDASYRHTHCPLNVVCGTGVSAAGDFPDNWKDVLTAADDHRAPVTLANGDPLGGAHPETIQHIRKDLLEACGLTA